MDPMSTRAARLIPNRRVAGATAFQRASDGGSCRSLIVAKASAWVCAGTSVISATLIAGSG